jgi:hypothetical protein
MQSLMPIPICYTVGVSPHARGWGESVDLCRGCRLHLQLDRQQGVD